MSYFVGGRYKRYTCKDLAYDVKNGSLRVLNVQVTPEWYAAADAAKEAEFIKNIFSNLGFPDYGAIPLLCDNQSTIKQTLNAVDQRSSRHLGMRSHFLRQQCHSKRLGLHFVPSRYQIADIFTKVLPRPAHEFLRSKIGVMSPTEFHSWRASDHKP